MIFGLLRADALAMTIRAAVIARYEAIQKKQQKLYFINNTLNYYLYTLISNLYTLIQNNLHRLTEIIISCNNDAVAGL